jgi:4-hydroxy-tetrahydrodipicolinate synthase
MVKELIGVLPIILTPCDENGRLDLESLKNEVEWCIENGVHGFFLGNCSEMWAYSFVDRNRIIKTVIDAANGKASLAAGCFALNTGDAVELSKAAEDLGADSIFMYGPRNGRDDVDIVGHYKMIDAAVDIPICAYNTPGGAPGVMQPEKLNRILDACPGVEYLKTGEPTVPEYLRTIQSGIGNRVKVICGKSHMNFRFFKAYPKAVGMTGCIMSILPAEHVEMWNHLARGNIDKARETWISKILPFLDLMQIGGAQNVRKEALYQMGIIKSASPVKPFTSSVCDDFHKKEINEILKRLGKL